MARGGCPSTWMAVPMGSVDSPYALRLLLESHLAGGSVGRQSYSSTNLVFMRSYLPEYLLPQTILHDKWKYSLKYKIFPTSDKGMPSARRFHHHLNCLLTLYSSYIMAMIAIM